MAHEELAAGDLTVVIGDNAADGEHRAGYNGIWRMKHSAQPETPFVPTVAGLNLEHIFDGFKDADMKVFFEPRNAPMTLKRADAATVELHQPPTPTFHLESWTTFQLAPPDAVDFTFRCVPRQHAFEYGYIGLFWASYINAPEDKSMYFLGGADGSRGWQQLCTPLHNNQSTVCKRGHRKPLRFAASFRDCLHKNLSPLVYDEPFFFGRFRNMTLLFLFDLDERLRITHSPSGGGFNREHNTSNPAWDFQFIISTYDVNETYSMRGRLIYRPGMTRAQILDELAKWKGRG
jgi:hypothetical protein